MKSYYKVHAGPTYDIVHEHITKHRAANDAAVEWAEKHSLPLQGMTGTTAYFKEGIVPDKAVWKKGRKDGFTPRLKTEVGAVLAKEMMALPQFPSMMELIMSLIGEREMDFMHVNQHGWPGIVKNKKDTFYLLEIDDYWLPEDRTGLEEILASAYHREEK